jgi:hypothetical protein
MVQSSGSLNCGSASEKMLREVIKWTSHVFLGNTTLHVNVKKVSSHGRFSRARMLLLYISFKMALMFDVRPTRISSYFAAFRCTSFITQEVVFTVLHAPHPCKTYLNVSYITQCIFLKLI